MIHGGLHQPGWKLWRCKLRTDGRLHQGLSHLGQVEYFRIFQAKIQKTDQMGYFLVPPYTQEPIQNEATDWNWFFFLINGCRYYSILSHHGHILTLIRGSNKSSVEDLERTPWNTKHMARPSEHKASLCKSSPLWGNRGSPGCSTEWNNVK